MLGICECCIYHYLRLYSSFHKLMMKSQSKRVFRHVEHLWQLNMPFFAFLEQNLKLMMKTVHKRVSRHVEYLRLLHMPIFAFLKQFSKVDVEITVKQRFSACWAIANAVNAIICVSTAVFKSWWWNHSQIAFSGMLITCGSFIFLYLCF